MSYRDPLDAARARITALEELLDSQRFGPLPVRGPDDETKDAARELRSALAEERAEHRAALQDAQDKELTLTKALEQALADAREERARREAEVSLLRTKLEEAERAIQSHTSVFEAEQTMQRAEAEVAAARLRQHLVLRDTQIRELREEIRAHLLGDPAGIRAHYAARVRIIGTELAEQGSLARTLDARLDAAREALGALPPVDVRDREAIVERELAKRKVAIGEEELRRTRERIERLEGELTRITNAEAQLAQR